MMLIAILLWIVGMFIFPPLSLLISLGIVLWLVAQSESHE